MSHPLRQSTASQEIPLGYFVDSTDGNTEETALTIANTDIKLWKEGATTLANKNSGGATHISNGLYYAVLDATDTNTLGSLSIYVHVAGALAVKRECIVYPANVYDSLFAGTDKLFVDAVEFNSSAGAAATVQVQADSIEEGTAQAGAAGNITLRAGAPSIGVAGGTIILTGGTGAGQQRSITAYNTSTKVASVDPNWETNPDSTTTYQVLQTAPNPTSAANLPPVSTNAWNGTAVASPATSGYPVVTIKPGTGTGEVSLTSGKVVASSVQGNVTGDVNGSVQGDVAGYVLGNVVGSVGSVGTAGITAASIAPDAIGASELAADAATEIATAVWASATRALTATGLDAITASDPGGVASTFPQMVVALWRRFYKKTTKTTTQVKTLADDGSTVRTTQAITDDGAGNQTLGAAT